MQVAGHSGAAGGDAGLVERSGQLRALGEALAAVAGSSRGRLVLVAGEAGIGKTALLRRFCGGVGGSARMLWAACDPLYTPRPLGPLLDLAGVTGGELRERVEGGAKPHDVAAALLRELGSGRTTVVVLEDVHWADKATLDVVRLVGRRVGAVPALFLISFRDDQLGRSDPLRVVLGDLAGGGTVTRVGLDGLSRAGVAALAEPLGIDPAELHDRTGGNPFFVTEVLAAGTGQIPQTVRDAVLARAARLGPAARELLDAAAVVPQRAELWLLEALAPRGLQSLEQCLSSGMLVAEAGGVAFRHEIARLVVEESLAPDRRTALHRRALTALAEPVSGAPDLARLAHHAEAAADTGAVLRYAPAAAEHAAAVGAHREAMAQYARALRFAGRLEPQGRARLLGGFGYEAFLTDQCQEAAQALREAVAIHRDSGDLMRQGETLRMLSQLAVCSGRFSEARAAAYQAVAVLEQLPPGPELARAYAAVSAVHLRTDEADEAITWSRKAIELAGRAGDTAALTYALTNAGSVELLRGDPAGADKLGRSIDLAARAGLASDAGRAYIWLVYSLGRRQEWLAADRYLRTAIDYCRDRGQEGRLRSLLARQAESELALGRWADAAGTATQILNAPPNQDVEPRCIALLVRALVRARQGDPGYWPLLDEALGVARFAGVLQYLAPVAVARAEAAWLEGRPGAVAGETQAAFELAVARQERWYAGDLAVWRWRSGSPADPPAGIAQPYRLEVNGDSAGAARWWAEKGCPYQAALALAGSGDAGMLRRALDEVRTLGAGATAAVITRRLRELGERGLPRGPRPSTRANPAGLTGRELDVLRLLTAGRTNAQIGAVLFISPKTAGVHVTSILRKLGVSSRAEAAAMAERAGLLP